MHRLHLTRNLRTLSLAMVLSSVATIFGALWWANQTGLPESWRTVIEQQIAKQGAYVEIGALSYLPLRGVLASDVRVFADPARSREISRLERVLLDFDKTKLARGKVLITRIELKNAGLTLPVYPDDPKSEVLEVTHANGIVLMPGRQRLEIRNASGLIEGIQVNVNARLIGYRRDAQNVPEEPDRGKRRELLARVIAQFKKWHFDPSNRPSITLFLDGDANDNSSLTAKITLAATGVEKNGHMLDQVSAEGIIAGDLLTITSLRANDRSGAMDARIDYDLSDREGRFDFESTLEVPALLEAWLGLPPMAQVKIEGRQNIEAEGSFRIDEQKHPRIHMTGSVRCESVVTRDTRFESVATRFSWRDGDFFAKDLRVEHAEGALSGKMMIQWPLVRIALDATLPARVYEPFFPNTPLEKVLKDFDDHGKASYRVKLEGGFDATDKASWAYTGSGHVENVSYRGVPVHLAECRLALSHHELDFTEGTVVFNYHGYPLRKEFDGPGQATAKVGRIRYDHDRGAVDVEDVTGAIWAAPLVRLFAPKVADSLEVYRFHQPPQLTGNGVVDVKHRGQTELDIVFSSDSAANYQLLGADVTLVKPQGTVLVRDRDIQVRNLQCEAFGGPLTARFDYLNPGDLNGEVSWNRLAMPELASTYGFQLKGGGRTTGRIEFSLKNGRIRTMNGNGLFALESTELFSVPIFGPLSPVISSVLGDRRAGFERAKNAICNFRIDDGILSTRDFSTATKSISFTGDGAVDLETRTLDMTMRMNARGLLGLITFPLRPFYGMFQFRGTGDLKKPRWENVMFTAPPEEQGKLLEAPPKAKAVDAPPVMIPSPNKSRLAPDVR